MKLHFIGLKMNGHHRQPVIFSFKTREIRDKSFSFEIKRITHCILLKSSSSLSQFHLNISAEGMMKKEQEII